MASAFWTFAVSASFVGFLISLFGAIRHGFDSRGARRPSLMRWLAACAFCLGAWALSLSRAPAPLPSPETRERAALLSKASNFAPEFASKSKPRNVEQ